MVIVRSLWCVREYRVTVVIFIKDPFSHLSCSYRGFSSHLFKKNGECYDLLRLHSALLREGEYVVSPPVISTKNIPSTYPHINIVECPNISSSFIIICPQHTFVAKAKCDLVNGSKWW